MADDDGDEEEEEEWFDWWMSSFIFLFCDLFSFVNSRIVSFI